MNPKKRILSLLVVGASLSIGFVGCGGGGGGSSAPTTAVTKTGTFVDSPVEGLSYKTATLSGFTDNQGRFQYKDGETVTFKIGNLVIGSGLASRVISPFSISDNNVTAVNIARLLQTLDNNQSDKFNLKLPNSLKDLNVSNIDLKADADLNTILARAQSLTSKSYILKDSTSAYNTMKVYTNAYSIFKTIKVGQKISAGIGAYKYILEMPQNGVVDFGYSSNGNNVNGAITEALAGGSVKLFDINGTALFNGALIHKASLNRGIYLVELNIFKGNNSITLYSTALQDYTLLPLLQNKTYQNIYGATYYHLNMPSNSNINIDKGTTNVYNGIEIFDTNMTLINHLSSGRSGTFNLNAGDYIVKFMGGTGDDITIYSPVLN